MKRHIALALIPAFALPGPALAGDCRRVFYDYHAPAYHTPYVAPTYYTPPTYYDPYVTIIARAVPVYAPLAAYTSIQDDVRAFYSTKEAVRQGTVEGMREFAASQPPLGPPAAPPALVPPLAAPNVSAPPIPPAASPNARGKATPVANVLAAKCAGCHKPGGTSPDLSGDPARIDELTRLRAFAAVVDGAMPKKGEPLTQDELNVFHTFAKGK